MSSNSDDIQAAGSDTRPPMLDRTDYESWSQRIRLYCRGKKNGLQILQSIDQGPFELGTTRNTLGTTPEGGVLLGPERPRTYEDLSDTEKKRYDADVRATNIVLQGLPKDIYKLINHNIEAKAIWDNVKMLLAGSELTKEDRESQLYDEFERFKMLPGENINEYYVRFHKLVNDMRNIRMTMPNIQLNSKFVNNMSPEWDRFVTAVKLNKGLKETNHEQLYAYLKQHEKHAAQDRLIIERITPATNDQLAFVSTVQPHAQSSHVQSHQYPSSSTNPQSLQYPQFPETSQIDSGYTQTDEILDNLTKQMALLAQSFRATLPQTNNQLRTSSNTRNQATIQDGNRGAQNRAGNANAGQGKSVKSYNCNGIGHIARNCTQPKRPQNSDYFKDKMLLMQAQENGIVLDEEELLFLAGEQVNECDAFDLDVDDEPTAQSIFMANLSLAEPANPQAGPSNASILSEVHILENAIDHSVTNQDKHEIHNEVQQANVIDSTSVDMGNSNVIPYEQYLSVDNISVVPSCASSALNDVCVSSDNVAFVPHDPIATELKIYKEQVTIYEQCAKFELTEREQ
ncbi:retrovirus-related pol polyprotein from transposon TNT 1-94 [Tanacetum coccineum]